MNTQKGKPRKKIGRKTWNRKFDLVEKEIMARKKFREIAHGVFLGGISIYICVCVGIVIDPIA